MVEASQQVLRPELQQAVTRRLGDGEGAVERFLRPVRMAHHPETGAEKDGDQPRPRVVAQPLGECFRLAHVPHPLLNLAEQVDGVAKVEADVDRLLKGLAGLREDDSSR